MKERQLYIQSEQEWLNIAKVKQVLLNPVEQLELFTPTTLKKLFNLFSQCVRNEPNVLTLNGSVTVVGDIHGQYRDLLKIISFVSHASQEVEMQVSQTLFMGDLVDRGLYGFEVTTLLMTLKVKFPTKIFILRGNHESRHMTMRLGFYDQVCRRYSQEVYDQFMTCFDLLPLACVINRRYFCVHGGISPQALSIAEINAIDRFVEVPFEGPICDLMWSDPVPTNGGEVSFSKPYEQNQLRGCSINYGAQLAHDFLRMNQLSMIIRAHEVQMKGYLKHVWPGWKGSPTVFTVFSAPNYCGTYRNMGAVVMINNESQTPFVIKQFTEQDTMCYLPEKYNAFNFSLPKIFEIINEFCYNFAARSTDKYAEFKKVPEALKLPLMGQYVKVRKTACLFKDKLIVKGVEDPNLLRYTLYVQSDDQKSFAMSQYLNESSERFHIELVQTALK